MSVTLRRSLNFSVVNNLALCIVRLIEDVIFEDDRSLAENEVFYSWYNS